MNKETITKIGERMVTKINVVNLCRSKGSVSNKLTHELSGMLMVIKAAEIPYEFIYSDEAQDYLQIKTLILDGQVFECEPCLD